MASGSCCQRRPLVGQTPTRERGARRWNEVADGAHLGETIDLRLPMLERSSLLASMRLLSAVRVLVADDSPRLRRLLRDAIEEVEGVEVVAEAADGVEALRGIRACAPGVVVLDLQMPVMGGLAALQHLRKSGERLQVIVLTNHADAIYREACLEAGADHFFDKSAELDRVLDLLRDLAETGEA